MLRLIDGMTVTAGTADERSIESIRAAIVPLAKKYGVRSVILFGSMARGDCREDSDCDLCIDLGDLRDGFRLGEFYLDVCQAVGTEVDMVDTESVEADFLQTILSEGVSVYQE